MFYCDMTVGLGYILASCTDSACLEVKLFCDGFQRHFAKKQHNDDARRHVIVTIDGAHNKDVNDPKER